MKRCSDNVIEKMRMSYTNWSNLITKPSLGAILKLPNSVGGICYTMDSYSNPTTTVRDLTWQDYYNNGYASCAPCLAS